MHSNYAKAPGKYSSIVAMLAMLAMLAGCTKQNQIVCDDDSTSEDCSAEPKVPIAAFVSPSNIYERCKATFVNESQNADTFQWTVGTTAISTEKDAVAVFNNAGDAAVTLTARSGTLSDSETQAIIVRQVPGYFDVNSTYANGRAYFLVFDGAGFAVSLEQGAVVANGVSASKLIRRNPAGQVVSSVTVPNSVEALYALPAIDAEVQLFLQSYDTSQGSDKYVVLNTIEQAGTTVGKDFPFGQPVFVSEIAFRGTIAFVVGTTKQTRQPFVGSFDYKTGQMLTFNFWQIPIEQMNGFAHIVLDTDGMYVTSRATLAESFDTDVAISRFDFDTRFVSVVGKFRRIGNGSDTRLSVALVNHQFAIGDTKGFAILRKDGTSDAMPGVVSWVKVLALSDGGLAVTGINFNGSKMSVQRFDSNLNVVAYTELAPKTSETRILQANSIAEGPDCSIVAVGEHSIGTSVVEYWPAYMKFSANLK